MLVPALPREASSRDPHHSAERVGPTLAHGVVRSCPDPMSTPFEKLNTADPAGSTDLSEVEKLELLKTLGRAGDPALHGANGSTIKSLRFYELPPHARYVIAKIIRRKTDQKDYPFWVRERDRTTVFQNEAKDLPTLADGAEYREYTVLRVTEPELKDASGRPRKYGASPKAQTPDPFVGLSKFASGAQRIVHADGDSGYYYTPTHYIGASDGSTYYNPFFLVTDIPKGHLSGTENETLHAPGF
jgi:hypothetical protein